ncbi:MAG: dihydrofolate reductase [Bacteroidetes bacterium]|nr:dihydrofolate reductase [Bacteroidota bacterium]
MFISCIVAAAKNNVIGKDNQMIWRLSTDLKRFKRLTTGKHILMGRKTFESLGKPLPNRTNIVVTRNEDYKAEGVVVFPSLVSAMAQCRKDGVEELFIIGGGEIYKKMLPVSDRLYLTRVLAEPEGDTYFPEIHDEDWMIVLEEAHLADEKNDHNYIFVDLERREAKSADESFPDTEHE